MSLPVMTDEFWRERLYQAIATGKDLHTIIYNTDYSVWKSVQQKTATILSQILLSGGSVLDAGCGYGSLFDLLPPQVVYVGIDISPELIRIAKTRCPCGDFRVGDVSFMPCFSTGEFDFCVCRSLRGMILTNVGEQAWKTVETELRRVAKKLVLLEYGDQSDGIPLVEIMDGRQ